MTDEPLRIAIVSTQRLWQGGEEQAWQLAQGLRRRGHMCTAIALQGKPFADRLTREDFPVLPVSGKLPWPWRLATVRHTLQKWQTQIVLCNDAHAITLGGLSAWRLRQTATVAARRASFPIRAPRRYRSLCDRVLCVSQAARRECLAAGIPDEMVSVVYDGVDPRRVASGDRQRGRAALSVAPDQLLLLSVGSLVPCKGHRVLLDALPGVVQQFPHVRLVIAGAGQLHDTLQSQIDRLQLTRHATLLGFRHDIPDLLCACDLFVFPSLEEGLGSTLIDAMLVERPIVTTNAGGIPDVVGDGAGEPPCAWTAAAGDTGALTTAILTALHNRQTGSVMAQRGKQRAEDHFTVDHMVEASVAEFRAVLNAKAAPK